MSLFRRRLMLSALKNNHRLPDGYVELEFIESTGTQYVVLDLPITKDTVCRIKFNIAATTGNCIMGSCNAFRFFNSKEYAYLDWGRGSEGGGRIHGGSVAVDTLYDVEFGDWYVKNLDTGDNIVSGESWGDTVRYNAVPINLMYVPNISPNVKAKGKFYLAQVYEKGKLVRNLLPCITDTGAIGLYDTVTGTFYGNAGDGEFVAGYL